MKRKYIIALAAPLIIGFAAMAWDYFVLYPWNMCDRTFKHPRDMSITRWPEPCTSYADYLNNAEGNYAIRGIIILLLSVTLIAYFFVLLPYWWGIFIKLIAKKR